MGNAAGSTRLCSGGYNYTGDLGDGTFGLFSYQADVLFDDFTFTRIDQINPAVPRWSASASAIPARRESCWRSQRRSEVG